jgi:membrane protein required for colicin V production
MILDIVFALICILAIFKGYQRGLIIGLFSLVAVIIGLAAAMKTLHRCGRLYWKCRKGVR